jgi:CRISPR system Cascade subunit CasA
MTRVLIPLMIDIFGLPANLDQWGKRWREGLFEAGPIDVYFAEHGKRFDLFHPETPFDQTPGLVAASGETKPTTVLLVTAPSGNNVPLWLPQTDAQAPRLDPLRAFTALETVQAYDTAAIKSAAKGDPAARSGKTTGNPVATLGGLGLVMPLGSSLFETLLLNLPTRKDLPLPTDGVNDSPHWRRPPTGPAWRAEATPAGVLDLLTWQSRRVLLIAEPNTDGEPTVHGAVLAAGDRMKSLPAWDYRTQWRKRSQPRAGQDAHYAVRHQPGRSGWHGLTALLAVNVNTAADEGVRTSHLLAQVGTALEYGLLPADYPLNLLLVGLEYGTQSAVVESVFVDDLPLPIRSLLPDDDLHDALIDVSQQAEALRKTLNNLEYNLRRAAGWSLPPGARAGIHQGNGPGDSLMLRLDGPVRQLLLELQSQPQGLRQALAQWETTAWSMTFTAAEILLNSASPEAFRGRRSSDSHLINVALAETFFYTTLRKILALENERRKARPEQFDKKGED